MLKKLVVLVDGEGWNMWKSWKYVCVPHAKKGMIINYIIKKIYASDVEPEASLTKISPQRLILWEFK